MIMFMNIQLFAHKKERVLRTTVVIANPSVWAPNAPTVNSFSLATSLFAKEARSIIRATTFQSARTIRCLRLSTAL